MKKRAFLVLLALVAMVFASSSCRCSRGEQKAHSETLAERSFKLPNGLAVDLVSGPCGDTAALVVLLNVGVDHDPPGRSGMVHLAQRLLASSAVPGRAQRTVEVGDDYTLYSVVVPGDRLPDELDAVAVWMARLPVTDADLGRERGQLLESLAKLQGVDATATAMSYAEEAVQPTRGNGRRLGIPTEVEGIDLPQLESFWQTDFRPGNARIIVAGRFDADMVRARVEAALGPLPAGTPPVARNAADATVKGTLVMGDTPTAVAVAVPAPLTSAPSYPAFLVLASRLLEGAPHDHSWAATYDPLMRPGLLFVTGPVAAGEQPEAGATRIRAEVAKLLARPLAPGDITAARERFQLFLGLHNLEPGACAKDPRSFAVARARRAQMGLDGLALDQALDKTTQAQLEEASKLFDAKHSAAVIAGGAIQ